MKKRIAAMLMLVICAVPAMAAAPKVKQTETVPDVRAKGVGSYVTVSR